MSRFRVIEVDGTRYINLAGVDAALDEVEQACEILRLTDRRPSATGVVSALRKIVRQAGAADLTEPIAWRWSW